VAALVIDSMPMLTLREKQVCLGYIAGFSPAVIEKGRGISPATVKQHVHAALRVLGIVYDTNVPFHLIVVC
jgi:DNA-binding NarL/FixJ family response regulator